MIEAGFVLVVFLGFLFLIMDGCWAVFAKATLQHAVRSGVRYAVTSQTSTSGGQQLGQVDSIRQVVQRESMGLLSASDTSTFVNVKFYSVSSPTPTPVTGVGANKPNNMVVVSVDNWNIRPITGFFGNGAPIPVSVSSGDLIESSGSGGNPPPL
jgi:Flp pilus assembly protein TadG